MPCLHIVAINSKLIETFGSRWLEILNHEKVLYCFIAPGVLGVLFYSDRNHVSCLL